MNLEDQFDIYWVCPKMRCKSMLIFAEPHLDCAYHGAMVRIDQIPWPKKIYRLWRKSIRVLTKALGFARLLVGLDKTKTH